MPNHPRSRGSRRLALRLALTAAILGGGPVAIGADFTVDNLNDSGAGSLRDAIASANLDPTGQHTISFDGALGDGTILLDSMLPMVELGSGGNTSSTGASVTTTVTFAARSKSAM